MKFIIPIGKKKTPEEAKEILKKLKATFAEDIDECVNNFDFEFKLSETKKECL